MAVMISTKEKESVLLVAARNNGVVTELDSSADDASEANSVIHVVPSSINLYHRISFVYGCDFLIPPQVQYYYYPPPPTSLSNGKPTLVGSPVFALPWNTKWQVSMTCNQWIGTQRWVSLYLTNLSPMFQVAVNVAIEFRVVNRERQVLKSMSNTPVSVSLPGGCTRGFTKFLPFSDIGKYLTESNLLLVEAHINLLCGDPPKASEISQEITSQDVKSEESATMGPPSVPSIFGGIVGNKEQKNKDCSFVADYCVDENDRLAILLDRELIAYASRTKFWEVSPWYQRSALEWEIENHVAFSSKVSNAPTEDTIRHCLQFVHEGRCDLLAKGHYDSLTQLLTFASDMEIVPLMASCVKEMNARVDIYSAAEHCSVLREFHQLINDEELESFRNFLRKKFFEICQTAGYQDQVASSEDYREVMVRLALDPNFKEKQKEIEEMDENVIDLMEEIEGVNIDDVD